MRSLSQTLLTAQRRAVRTPYLRVRSSNRSMGLVRLDWQRLYAGPEEEYFHCLVLGGDGSLVRARISPPSDGRKLLLQRTPLPGPSSNFSDWTETGQYNCLAVALASSGNEVSVFWVNAARELTRMVSPDCGATWGTPVVLDITASSSINGLACSHKPNGDLAVFIADQSTVYVKKCLSGTWQSAVPWDKTTGDLSGVAAVYGADWDLVITGKDPAGNYKAWSVVYGDGGEVGAETWSELQQMATAPAGGEFEYAAPFLSRTDAFRCSFVERFAGVEPYARPFLCHSIPGVPFVQGLWTEPAAFDFSSNFGLALASDAGNCWLSSTSGVWTAPLAVRELDLTPDVVGLRSRQSAGGGAVEVELRSGDRNPLSPELGDEVEVSPGYLTSSGTEASDGPSFSIETRGMRSSPGKATVFLVAEDGWGRLESWVSRNQFRWNREGPDKNIKDILAFVLARVGIRLSVRSESLAASDCPDFVITVGDNGKAVVARLLEFIPDLLLVEGQTAVLLNPESAGPSVYSFGVSHPVLSANYAMSAVKANEIRVEGRDTGGAAGSAAAIVISKFDWDGLQGLGSRFLAVEDSNLTSVAQVEARGEAVLGRLLRESVDDNITVPVHCGLQVFDVVDVTDRRCGFAAEKRRVSWIELVYEPAKGLYLQKLGLCRSWA